MSKISNYSFIFFLFFPSPKGIEYAQINENISALIINPNFNSFELATNYGYGYKNAKQWSEEEGFLAVTNAGMFDIEHKPVGMAKFNGKVIKRHNVPSYKMVFAIGNKPRLIDLENEVFEKERYHSYFQSIRMISSDGRNVWSKQNKKWSVACIAEDEKGNILFIHSRVPYTMHDFINELLNSDLNIKKAMYLEGGPEASLFINFPDLKADHIGSYETGFNENDDNDEFWDLPNVIGIKKLKK